MPFSVVFKGLFVFFLIIILKTVIDHLLYIGYNIKFWIKIWVKATKVPASQGPYLTLV